MAVAGSCVVALPRRTLTSMVSMTMQISWTNSVSTTSSTISTFFSWPRLLQA